MNFLSNMSARDRRAVLILVPSVAAILLFHFVIFPYLETAGDSSVAIASREKILRKYQNVAAAIPGNETTTASLAASLADSEKALLTGETPALQTAEMQQMFRDIAAAQGITLRSVEFTAPKASGDYALVSVSSSFGASMDQLVAFLTALQASPKTISVDRLRISAANVPGTPKDPMKKMVVVYIVASGVARGDH